MSSTDKMCCGRPIKRRCEVRAADAVFSSENRPDYLSSHTSTAEETVALSSSVFVLFIYLVLPHFRSGPQQLQTSCDTHRWLLPLA